MAGLQKAITEANGLSVAADLVEKSFGVSKKRSARRKVARAHDGYYSLESVRSAW
jgi:hypothetical protein